MEGSEWLRVLEASSLAIYQRLAPTLLALASDQMLSEGGEWLWLLRFVTKIYQLNFLTPTLGACYYKTGAVLSFKTAPV